MCLFSDGEFLKIRKAVIYPQIAYLGTESLVKDNETGGNLYPKLQNLYWNFNLRNEKWQLANLLIVTFILAEIIFEKLKLKIWLKDAKSTDESSKEYGNVKVIKWADIIWEHKYILQ